MTGIEKLKAGDFNSMTQDYQDDDSVIITLTSRHYPELYHFQVWDLYGPNEEVLVEEVNEGN